MVLTLNTAIRGEQIVESTISGAHILDAAIKPIKLNIVNSPEDGDVLTYNSANAAFEWEKVGTMIANESPAGSINGTNKVFTLSSSPEANSLEVYLNGILQQPGVGNDYTVSGTQITFTTAPEIGDIILCSYLTSVGLGGGYYTDHGNLNGLGDDDHLQYILVDGSRVFTGIVSYNSHPSFTANTNIVDKKYVDDLTTAVSGSIIKNHGNLTGLNDDDHTQYILVDGTRAFTNAVQYAIHPSFSVDTELVDKKYVDDSVSGLSPDLISEGNSKVEVVDIGTGYVTVEIDSAEVARFNDDNLRLAVDLLPEMTGASGSVSTRDIGSPSAKFNTIYCHDLRADAGSIYVNDKKVIEDVSDVITISTDPGQRLKISTTNDSGDVYISGEGGIQLVVPDTYSNHDITISNNSSGGDINIGGTGQTVKINGTVDLANATLDHGDLAGLSDDDHTQYILVNGARSFTGTIGGVTPTATNHLATKGYVDSVVQGLDWQDSVLDKDLTSPPASPLVGDRYLIANNATGAWSGHDGDIAEWNGSSWSFTAKNEGMAVWVEDENKLYTYNGSSWVIFGSTISHNNTSGLNDGDYKHLTANEYNGLTSGNNTTLHIHDSRYYTEAEADARFVLLTDYEDSDVLNKIKNVDGSGSGLDADLLDGHHASYFSVATHIHDDRYYTESEIDTISGSLQSQIDNKADTNHNHDSDYVKLADYEDADVLNKIKNVDGSGSGLDADLLDGHHASYFAISGHNHDSDYVKLTDYEDSDVLAKIKNVDGSGSGLDADLLDGHDSSYFATSTHNHDHGSLNGLDDDDHTQYVHNNSARTITAVHTFNPSSVGAPFSLGTNAQGQLIAGLNADKLDGYDASHFASFSHTHDNRYYTETESDSRFVLQTDYEDSDVLNKIKNVDGSGSGLDADLLDGHHASYFATSGHNHDSTYVKLTDYEDSDVLNKIKNVDGSGSGLDADLLDGHDSSYFAVSGHTHDSRYVNITGDEMTGTLKISGTTKTNGYLYAGSTSPTNSTRLNYDGYFYATKVYNAVYNDIADFQKIDDDIIYGKVYRLTENGAKICNERCQLGVIGVCSDTFGFGVGHSEKGMAPFAVAGWVLAYVDKVYTPGTPLTCDENGNLTEMTIEEKRNYPERLIAIYDRPELEEYWGPNNEVKVNGRHWVKIK